MVLVPKLLSYENYEIKMLYILIMAKVLTSIARDSPQDACQARQRSASPAVVHLQHGHIFIFDMRRNNQVLQIPLMDLRNFIQA